MPPVRSNSTAKIWIDYDTKKVMLLAPFSAYFNDLVKRFPRRFIRETKIWEFDIEFLDQLVDIASRVWTNVVRPPFLLMEIFEYLTEEDLKDMYSNLIRRHRSDKDKALLALINRFFNDYINLTAIMKKKRMIRLDLGDILNQEILNNLHNSAPDIAERGLLEGLRPSGSGSQLDTNQIINILNTTTDPVADFVTPRVGEELESYQLSREDFERLSSRNAFDEASSISRPTSLVNTIHLPHDLYPEEEDDE